MLGFNKSDSLIMKAMLEPIVENKESKEEWVWVEGYKGTDKDMKCQNNFQYEMEKQFDMPKDVEVELCCNGFHLCMDLDDVFAFYGIGCGNRFFKVKALVRKKDVDEYGTMSKGFYTTRVNKIVAKSIIFLNELTPDEIFESYPFDIDTPILDDDDKKLAMSDNINAGIKQAQRKALVKLGYSEHLSNYCVKYGKFDIAMAVGTQEEIDMVTRVNVIFNVNKGG